MLALTLPDLAIILGHTQCEYLCLRDCRVQDYLDSLAQTSEAELSMGWVDPWVGLDWVELGWEWVENFVLVGWVGCGSMKWTTLTCSIAVSLRCRYSTHPNTSAVKSWRTYFGASTPKHRAALQRENA